MPEIRQAPLQTQVQDTTLTSFNKPTQPNKRTSNFERRLVPKMSRVVGGASIEELDTEGRGDEMVVLALKEAH